MTDRQADDTNECLVGALRSTRGGFLQVVFGNLDDALMAIRRLASSRYWYCASYVSLEVPGNGEYIVSPAHMPDLLDAYDCRRRLIGVLMLVKKKDL